MTCKHMYSENRYSVIKLFKQDILIGVKLLKKKKYRHNKNFLLFFLGACSIYWNMKESEIYRCLMEVEESEIE